MMELPVRSEAVGPQAASTATPRAAGARARAGIGSRGARPLIVTLVTLAVTMSALSLPRPAQALFGDDQARKAILDLRARADSLEQDVNRRFEALLQAQQLIESRLAQAEQAQRGNIEQQNQLEGLRQEIARLRGQLEVQANQIASLGGLPSAPSGQAAASGLPGQVVIDNRQVAVDPGEKAAYDGALAQFRSSDFKAAATSFEAFTSQYPDSPLMPLALYWGGGARYASGDFKGALATLRQLQERYPASDRIPDGLVISGNAHADGGDRKAARETFRQIIEKYPDTSAAEIARERLKSLK